MTFIRRQLGADGEKTAVEYLKKQSYRILTRNFSSGLGEIDIICEREKTILFVEVKTRRTASFGSPLEAVNKRKQHQMAKTALCYIKANSLFNHSFRFDVIAITGLPDRNPELLHIENAFTVDEYMF